MKNKYLLIIIAIMAACSKPANDLDSKKKELESAQNELISLKEKIGKLEAEIKQLDPGFARNANAVLITKLEIEPKSFEHFIEVRGAVESRKNISLSAMTAGKIERVWVTEGQLVNAGQVLVTLEADILKNSIKEIKTSLELATAVYEKQSKLWSQKIGTEVQYLQAKNNKESLESRLATLNSQLEQTLVKAPFSGAIDRVDALVGEMASPGMPLLRMVNPSDVYIKADVSEDYAGKFSKGDKVLISFPGNNQKVNSTITSIGYVINQENRTFRVEMNFNAGFAVKPNQVAIVSFRDYLNPSVVSVPTKLIQRDNQGQFVFVTQSKNNTLVAHKVYVKLGQSYQGFTEILSGLEGIDHVINEGFRELTEGAEVKFTEQGIEKEVATK